MVHQNSLTVEFWWENIEGNLRRAYTEPSIDFKRANKETSVDFRKASAEHYIIHNNGILKSNSSIFPRSEGFNICIRTQLGIYGQI